MIISEVFKEYERAEIRPAGMSNNTADRYYNTGRLFVDYIGDVDIRYIADLMGHESLDTTRIYTHFTNPKLKMIYDKAQGSDPC